MTIADVHSTLIEVFKDTENYGDEEKDHQWIEMGINLFWIENPQ